MQMTPVIAIHLNAILAALALGPVALWARQGRSQRPRLHRAAGYAWVTLIVTAAVSAMFIRDYRLPNIAGYTPIHLLVPVTLGSLVVAFRKLFRGDVAGHARWMRRLYVNACWVAGAFTLLPGRFLGNLVWGRWLGLIAPDYTPPPGPPPVVSLLAAQPTWLWIALAAVPIALLARRFMRRPVLA